MHDDFSTFGQESTAMDENKGEKIDVRLVSSTLYYIDMYTHTGILSYGRDFIMQVKFYGLFFSIKRKKKKKTWACLLTDVLWSSMPEWSVILDNTCSQTFENNINRLDPKKKGSTNIKEILKLKRFLPMWNKMFLLVCVIAVSLDPLFFYIPMINEEKKCITMDQKLTISALTLRTITDIVYIIDIIYNVAKAYKVLKRENPCWKLWEKGQLVKNGLAMAQRLSWFLIFVDFLAILPIPQVL